MKSHGPRWFLLCGTFYLLKPVTASVSSVFWPIWGYMIMMIFGNNPSFSSVLPSSLSHRYLDYKFWYRELWSPQMYPRTSNGGVINSYGRCSLWGNMSPPKTFAFERCDASPKAFAIISVLFLSDRHWIKAVQLSSEEGLPKQLYMNLYHSQSLLRRLRILQDMSTVLPLRAKSIILAIISIFGVFSVCRIFYNKSQPLVNPSYQNPGGIKKRSSFYTGMEPQNRLSPSATTVSNEKCSIFDKLRDFRSNIPKELREAHRRWFYFVRFNQSIQAFQIKAEFFFFFSFLS